MGASSSRTLIVVAIIGLVGTLGAAAISNWDRISLWSSASSLVPPHAPPIEINQRFTMWEEKTMQFRLEPGESKTLKGMELYADVATYPTPSCAGPGFVPYTWQVRVPYPRGGDLEIRALVPMSVAATEQVGLGSMGRGRLGWCDEHTLKNNGVEPIQIEIRYATAADLEK